MTLFFRKKLSRVKNHFFPKENIDNKIVTLGGASSKIKGKIKGKVLLSYIIEPFLLDENTAVPNTHTHYWESLQMAKTFMELGYQVDVISYRNFSFKPQADYNIFVSARSNFEIISKQLPTSCIKVAHLDTSHWLTNNCNAYQRMYDLEVRKKVSVLSARIIEVNRAIECADMGCVLGNQFTIDSYAFANKPIYRIPISAPSTYPWNDDKDFNLCRNNYLWFGSSGFVHKGLDLVLDAFKDMPDYQLTVFGPINQEKDFVTAYQKELYETPNIKTVGWIDVDSKEFLNYAKNTMGLIYPTCAEGGGGSAITCMHAGIIPILSYEASVDIPNCGFLLDNCSVEEIKKSIAKISNLPADELKSTAKKAWQHAQATHTKENFSQQYREFVTSNLLSDKSLIS